jgi:hypothetical protein
MVIFHVVAVSEERHHQDLKTCCNYELFGGAMITRSFLVMAAVLLFAGVAVSQFGPSSRVVDLASRLSRDADDFADSSYRGLANNSSGRNDVDAVMLAYQFAGASRIFSRMAADRRRNQDLRDAFDNLQNLARAVERNDSQRNGWFNIQRTMQDISRELNDDSAGGPGQFPGPAGHGGRMTWRGRVDDDVRIRIRGGSAEVETIGGTPYYDGQPNFDNSLPNRRVTVRLTQKHGRGDVFIEQQPTRENDFTAVIRIKDPKGGASQYDFTLEW